MRNPEKKGLQERLNDSIFNESEFKSMAENWAKRGWISPEDIAMIDQTLQESEVKKLIETWMQILPFSLGITYFRETGSVGAGLATKSMTTALGTYLSTLLVQSTVMGAVAKKKLKGLPSSKVVPWLYFTPMIGDFAPLIYLSKTYPNFLRLLWAYRATKGTWKKQRDSANQGKLQQYIYQKTEARQFEKSLKDIDRLLRWTNKFWNRVNNVIGKTNQKDDSIDTINPNNKDKD